MLHESKKLAGQREYGKLKLKNICEHTLRQMEEKDYAAKLRYAGMRNIIKYEIVCYKKNSGIEIDREVQKIWEAT